MDVSMTEDVIFLAMTFLVAAALTTAILVWGRALRTTPERPALLRRKCSVVLIPAARRATSASAPQAAP